MQAMPEINDAPDSEIKRRFSVESAERWRLLLRHFSWSDDFAFIALLVPNASAGELCARELETFFRDSGKRLVKMTPKTPGDLADLIAALVTFEPDSSVGALWVSAVVSEADPERLAWEQAWRELAARLNERRDVMRFHVKIPMIFVGTEWLKPMLRETAPDLWSVRTLVVACWSRSLQDLIRRLMNQTWTLNLRLPKLKRRASAAMTRRCWRGCSIAQFAARDAPGGRD